MHTTFSSLASSSQSRCFKMANSWHMHGSSTVPWLQSPGSTTSSEGFANLHFWKFILTISTYHQHHQHDPVKLHNQVIPVIRGSGQMRFCHCHWVSSQIVVGEWDVQVINSFFFQDKDVVWRETIIVRYNYEPMVSGAQWKSRLRPLWHTYTQ